jgi:hypothetical protein
MTISMWWAWVSSQQSTNTERSIEGCVFDDNNAGDCAVTTAGGCQSR